MCPKCRIWRRVVDEARERLLDIMDGETRPEKYRAVGRVVMLLSRSGRLKEAYDATSESSQADRNGDRVHKVPSHDREDSVR